MWEMDHNEGWALKNWCFQTVVLEETLVSPLDSKEILLSVNLKGNQPWVLTGRAEAEAPIRWPPDAMSWLIGKNLDAGKDWRQEKRATEDEVVAWDHWCNGQELGPIPGDCERQGSLVCCSPRGLEELDTACWLNISRLGTLGSPWRALRRCPVFCCYRSFCPDWPCAGVILINAGATTG